MRSRHHAFLSALVGIVLVAGLDTEISGLLLVAYATLLGTLVDLDHFVIARARTGSWDALERAIRDPRMALLDQSELFDTGDVGAWTRIASHVVITVGLVVCLSLVAPVLAIASAAVLGLHTCCDCAWDSWRRRSSTSA